MAQVPNNPGPPKANGNAEQLTKELDDLNDRLSNAARDGDLDEIKQCLDHGANVNTTTYTGRTPLWSTVYWDRDNSNEVIKLLLDRGAGLENRDDDGETALWRATLEGNSENVKLLLNRGAEPNARTKLGVSVLLQACSQDNTEIVKLLLETRVGIEAEDANGLTPLRRALANKYREHVDLLLAKNAKITKQMFFAAAELGVEKILRALLSRGDVDIEYKDDNGLTVLWYVLASKSQSCIKFILSFNPEIDVQGKDGENMMHQAARFGNKNMLESLVGRGVFIESVDPHGRTPLWLAVDSGDEECVKLLLGQQTDINAQDSSKVSILHQAVYKTHVHIVKLLLGISTKTQDQPNPDLEHEIAVPSPNFDVDAHVDNNQDELHHVPHSRPDINTKDEDDETPLIRAVINESEEIVNILLFEKGVKLQGVDADGDTELGRAAWSGNEKIVAALLKASADTEKANRDGRTPLYWAAWNGAEAVAKLLLVEGNCHIAIPDSDGQTPFHAAVERGYVSLVKLLLDTSATRKKQPKNTGSRLLKARSTINLDANFPSGDTALHLAASNGYDEIVKILLDHNANTTALNKNGSTPLHIATEEDDIASWKLLLPKMEAAGVEKKNDDGNNALHLACKVSNKTMVQDLLARIPAKVSPISRNIVTAKNRSNETPLSIAVQERSADVLQLLINVEADIKYVDEDGRKWATMEDSIHDIAAAGQLLADEERWTIPEDRKKTLNWGARNGDKLLVEKAIKFNPAEKDAAQALKWAAVGGKGKIVEFLFEKHELDDSTSFAEELKKLAPESVQCAARNGHELVVQQVIQWLIKKDEDYSRDKQSPTKGETWTPLHWAVRYKASSDEKEDELQSMDIVRNMIMNGSNPYPPLGQGPPATKLADDLKQKGNSLSGKILDLLESPLRALRKPLQLIDPSLDPSGGHNDVCTRFHTNIVDFYTSGDDFCTLERKSPINHIIYDKNGGPDRVMNNAMNRWELDDIGLKHRFRWIHLPANNWTWANDLMARISSDSRVSAIDYSELQNFVDLNRREHQGKPQVRFMYPAVTFESNDFHSGEGANIPRLRAEAKEKKRLKAQESKKPDSKVPMTSERLEPSGPALGDIKQASTDPDGIQQTEKRKEVPQPGSGQRNEESNTASNQVSSAGTLEPNPANNQKVVISEKTPQKPPEVQKKGNEKPKAIEKKVSSRMQGSKLLLSMPFLTFQTVKSHRALRQAIRLAGVVEELKSEGRDRVSLDKQVRLEARQNILQSEIYEGLILLHDSGSADFEKLNEIAERPVSEKMKESGDVKWLKKLEHFHESVRRTTFTSSQILEWLERFLDAIEIAQRAWNDDKINTHHMEKQELLMEYYLKPNDADGLHTSRTLDQYYYSALADTSRRDVDQVARRYQARRVAEWKKESPHTTTSSSKARVEEIRASRKALKWNKKKAKTPIDKNKNNQGTKWVDDPDAKIAMVDQLWLWIVDDGKNKTLISCFPRGWDSETKNGTALDLLDKIRKHIHDESRPTTSSVYHLAAIITSFCISYIEECKANLTGCHDPFLDMFAGSIGIVADEEVKCFETFKTDLDKIRENNNSHNDTAELELNIIKEITLLEEVKDIRDELNILKSVFGEQKSLLNKLLDLVTERQPGGKESVDPVLNYYRDRSDISMRIKKVKKMDMDASGTYASINHLLDLKQKNANLFEAYQARKQTEQTTKQGRTIMVFTIVTIIFLPLSFLTSLYALNIESFAHIGDGDDWIYQDKWIFPRIFGTSAAIGLPLIWLAIYINTFLDMYRRCGEWWTKRQELSKFDNKKQKTPSIPPVRQPIPPTPSQMESQKFDLKSGSDTKGDR